MHLLRPKIAVFRSLRFTFALTLGAVAGCTANAPDGVVSDAAVVTDTGASDAATADVATADPACEEVCQKYRDCVDATFDVVGCVARCAARSDATSRQQLTTCRTCVAGASCVDAAFRCTDACNGVVP